MFRSRKRVGDCSSSLWVVRLAAGEGDRDDDPQGFRAKLTIRPDMERVFNGRATGSGARVSGTLAPLPSCCDVGLLSLRSSVEERVKCETARDNLSGLLARNDVRRRISFPAATVSFVGESERVGTAQSEKVRLKPDEVDWGDWLGRSVKLAAREMRGSSSLG